MELYVERGFEQTTVAEIAKRAGLTERTFFRHFADKREVLFWGAATLQEHLVNAVASTPDSAAPIDAIAAAIEVGRRPPPGTPRRRPATSDHHCREPRTPGTRADQARLTRLGARGRAAPPGGQ